MGTSVENSLTNFDLDLLLGPASTSISHNTEITDHDYAQMGNSGTTNHGYQVKNMETTDYVYKVQNMADTCTTDYVYEMQNIGNTRPTDHSYQIPNVGNTETMDNAYKVQNKENKIFLPGNMVKKSDYDTLKINHDVNMKDYESLKKQFSKLASDFSILCEENQNNAMAALKAEALNEQLKQELAVYKTETSALQKQHERLEINYYAGKSSVTQFANLVSKLQTDVLNLHNDLKSEKINGKDGRKIISTLKKNNDTLNNDLCKLASIIEDKTQLDQEARRLVKKYCKKNTSGSNKSVESENFESHSNDTGRASSLAFSDGERSFYSPAFSLNFSPMSTGSIYTRNEQPKMKDASSSPTPMNKTFDKSTSPIIFEEAVISPPSIKIVDVSTSPIYHESRTLVERTKMLDIATSPVEFVGRKTPVAMTNTSNMATSPIGFSERKIAMTIMSDIATSPVKFADWKTPVANVATSPIKFDEEKVHMTKMVDMATSPIESADVRIPVSMKKTLNIIPSPIEFEDTTPVEKIKTWDIVFSPIKCAEAKIPAIKTNTLNMTRSIECVEANIPTIKTKRLDMTKPKECVKSKFPAIKTHTLDMTKPIECAEVKIQAVKTSTLDINIPIECAEAKIPVIKTDPLDINRPMECAKVNISTIEIKKLNMTRPIECAEANIPANKTKRVDMTKSKEFVEAKIPAIKTNTLDITRPIECAETKIPAIKTNILNMTRPIEYAEVNIPTTKIKSLDMTKPKECLEAKIPAIKANTLDMIKPIECAEEKISAIKTNTLDMNRTMECAKVNVPTIEIKTSNMTRPIECAEANIPTIKTKRVDMTKSKECVKISAIKTNTLDTTRPVECADTKITAIKTNIVNIPTTKTKRLDMTKPKECVEAKIPAIIINTLDIIRPLECAEAKIPVIETNTLDINKAMECADVRNTTPVTTNNPKTGNLISINSVASNCSSPNIQEIVKNPISMSKHTNFIKNSQESIKMNEISVKLNEIVFQNSHHSQNDEENDREIKMILSKQSLNWDMLSPMSLTPEVDEENDQSLHISGDESSEDEIVRDDYDFSNLVLENPRNVDPSEDIFDHIKNSAVANKQNDSIKNKNTASLFGDDNSESPTKISNKSYSKLIKNHGPPTKYKKLTNLQKIYKANIPKSKIKSHIPSVKKQCIRPTPYSVSPIKYDLASNTNNNNPKRIKLGERNVKKLLFKNQGADEAYKESKKCNFKKPQPLTASGLKRNAIDSQSDSDCGKAHTPICTQPESDRKKVCMSTETHSNSKGGLLHTQTNPLPESGPKQKACISTAIQSNNLSSIPPHTQANPLLESCLKERFKSQLESSPNIVCMPTEAQSNHVSGNPYTQTLLESSPLKTKACVSTETQSDLISSLPHNQTNPLPEFGRKRGLNMSMVTKCNNKNKLSNAEINLLPECEPNLPTSKESISESDINYSYTKPPKKRIARVGKDISRNPPDLPSFQRDNFINDKISSACDTINHNKDGDESPPSKRIRVANDLITSDVLDNANTRLQSMSPQEKAKEANISSSKIKTTKVYVSNNENGLRDIQQSNLNIDKASTPIKLDDNIHPVSPEAPNQTRHFANYNDLNMFATLNDNCNKEQHKVNKWRRNILNRMILKYGSNQKQPKKPIYNDAVAAKIQIGVAKCVKSSKNREMYMKDLEELVKILKEHGEKEMFGGLMKFISDPARKADFIPKTENKSQKGYPLRCTTSQSVITLIDLLKLLHKSGINLWKLVLDSCEYILFTLEKGATPVFDVIESVTNLYVNICKYHGDGSKIWIFMLNAMYCLSFKAIPLIKQCLDLVPNILPNANTCRDRGFQGTIRCFVFLLHYYNCDDRFRRVDELRIRLRNKYSYNLQDENETTILFMLRTAIIHLAENEEDRSMTALCLLIVAKRRGTKWCQKNIVKLILLPIIKGEIEASLSGRRFCLTTIGKIMKPYNNEMTVYSQEVVDLLIAMFEQPHPQEIKEDIIRGLINMNMKRISDSINKCLLNWNPPSVSPEFEEDLHDYIDSKPLKSWMVTHSKNKEI